MNKKHSVRQVVWLVILSLVALVAVARISPVAVLRQASEQMIAELQEKRVSIKTNKKLVFKLVQDILLPHVDMYTMSRLVLSRSVWNNASAQQKELFQQQFTTMLIRTYAAALAEYNDEKIVFSPLRGDYNSADRMQVQSMIVRRGGPTIHLNYQLRFKGDAWLVYDFSVEGVSLIESMRAQFAGEIARGGLDGLLVNMRQHNKGY